jgi:signal peptidase II
MPNNGEISVATLQRLAQTKIVISKDFLKKIIIVVFILSGLVFLDQWTKVLAVENLKDHPTIYFLNGMFQLIYAENPGAFLGMGGGWSQTARFFVFGIAVVIGLLAMFTAILKDKINSYDFYAYTFILAGGIGNVIDRLTHENGHVVDFLFIDLQIWSWLRTGVFNVADICIVIGVIIAFWPSLFTKKIKTIKN